MATGGAGFSDEERAAMKQRAEELKAMKGLKGAAKLEKENEACLEAIDKLEGVDRAVAERLHVIVLEEAAHLNPKTFYGFPAYAKDGKVVVFYQPGVEVQDALRHGELRRQRAARRRPHVAGVVRGRRGDGHGRAAHSRGRARAAPAA